MFTHITLTFIGISYISKCPDTTVDRFKPFTLISILVIEICHSQEMEIQLQGQAWRRNLFGQVDKTRRNMWEISSRLEEHSSHALAL